jgi:hypothetical protein
LAVVFVVWYRQEGTLAIRSVDTRRRELFYWAAILVTFALGTAAGDLSTEAFSLGFRNGVLIFGSLIFATFAANRLGTNGVLAFWIAYVLTRPLGASLGDLLTQDRKFGGLGLGAAPTSIMFFSVITILVVREQMLANRHGVASKGDGPFGGSGRDYAWAGAGAALVVLLPFGLNGAHAADTAGQATTGAASVPAKKTVHPTTALGDLSNFATIANSVQSKVAANDLAGAKARVKDLEVAWDSAEAGLKPRDPSHWRQLDGDIDAVLTALRASSPSQTDCAATLKTLVTTLNTFDGM